MKCTGKMEKFLSDVEENVKQFENDTSINDYICDTCEEDFDTNIGLTKHRYLINLSLIECTWCNKSPFKSDDYEQHNELHIIFIFKPSNYKCS